MKDILIVGYGNIGKRIHKELEGAGRIDIYDINPHINSTRNLKIEYDVAFVCVPTEMLPDGSCNISAYGTT